MMIMLIRMLIWIQDEQTEKRGNSLIDTYDIYGKNCASKSDVPKP